MLSFTACPDESGKSRFAGKKLEYWKYCLIIVSLVLVSIQIQAQNGWTHITDLPTTRVAAAVEVINGKIYIIGGNNGAPNFSNLAVNEAYDPSKKTWDTTLAPMPTPRGFLASGVVRDTIYAIGGGYSSVLRNVEAYDPVNDNWSTKADMLNPRFCMRAAVVDGIIYVFGGNYNQHNCQAYNPITNEWIEKTSIPIGGGGNLSVTVYNGLIYTFGGSTYPPWVALSTVYAYNPQKDTWDTSFAHMPTPRFGLQTFLFNEKIYAIGGSQSSGTSLATVEVYDPVTDTWDTTSPDMPFNSLDPGQAIVDNKIYVISGTPDWATGDGWVWEYDPSFHVNIPPGNVSGTWTTANSPYHILGEITIPNDSTLTIEPGVEVVFMGHYKFNVQGRLIAVGTRQDTISFTADSIEIGWHGIRFFNTPNTNDTSKMVYCSFKYGMANTGGYSSNDRCGGAIMIYGFDKVLISNSLFESNMNNGDISPTIGGAAIFIQYASPTITTNTFRNNSGTTDCAILCTYGSIYNPDANPIITNNLFLNNSGPHGPVTCCYNNVIISGNFISGNVTTRAGGGIFTLTTNALITNNMIINNQCFGGEGEGGGIKCWINDKSIIINNTIAYNNATHGGGICCNQNSDPILINNIIWENTATYGNQVNLLEATSDPNFFFCDIQGGKEEFGGNGSGVNYTGQYENNIDSDPLFVDVPANDFRLTDYSPCIGAGVDSIEIENLWYNAPLFCIYGNPRPSPAGTSPDIGACENLLGSPLPVEFVVFTANKKDNQVTLNWLTATETNNSGFEIERRTITGGVSGNWNKIGFTPGFGTTTEPKEYSYVDNIIGINGTALAYRLKQVDFDGSFEYSDVVEVDFIAFNSYLLEQNYPNPFNPTTTIGFGIENKSNVKIAVFNSIGEEVLVLLNEEREPGFHQVEFNAANLPSGVYFYQLRAGSFMATKKMILMK